MLLAYVTCHQNKDAIEQSVQRLMEPWQSACSAFGYASQFIVYKHHYCVYCRTDSTIEGGY